jgi:FtsP/CotA-like multicopper oxidase with cupredoxin domain
MIRSTAVSAATTVLVVLVFALSAPSFARDGCPDGQAPAFPGSLTCLLDPLTIPKYVTPLVIPPVMRTNGTADRYDIAVRQFKQQILPGGFPATTVWSYGPAADPTPAVAPDPTSQFNYPAYTIETRANVPVSVRWINDLVRDPDACKGSAKPGKDPACRYLSHLLPVDQTLHWANPPQKCDMEPSGTDCMGSSQKPYLGPVPIVTHVHGAHVDGHSDGYPEAWWLPAANNIPASYARHGRMFDDVTGTNPGNLGYADFRYRQDQPATTLWYHDHALGMTRTNVYAGPAGFWLVRGGPYDETDNVRTGVPGDGILPGPAPRAGQDVLSLNTPGNAVRDAVREIPIAIQDRSFTPDGSLFYAGNRAFFEGLNPGDLQVPFAPKSDVAPIWNPEAFFNTIVVNGVTWPKLEVAPAIYRFRLLNGSNSRFLNLSLKIVSSPLAVLVGKELSFYQIGAEQGFLPKVVEIRTGFATPLPGDGAFPSPADRVPAPDPDQGLLMGLAERADVLVDFRLLPPGTVVRMLNEAPDEPFGGFDGHPGEPAFSDSATTGQVMQFVVNWSMLRPRDLLTTSPWALRLAAEPSLGREPVPQRKVSLNEAVSEKVCVYVDELGVPLVPIKKIPGAVPPDCTFRFKPSHPSPFGAPFGPTQALLGTVDFDPVTGAPFGVPLRWTDTSGVSRPVDVTMADGVTLKTILVTENPRRGNVEEWKIYNFTEDAHPIHLHLVRFDVVGRTDFDGFPSPHGSVQPWETGFKDTVIAYPGEITTVRATFDIEGLYVWHCHIVEHEDNEMMRPFVVSPAQDAQ